MTRPALGNLQHQPVRLRRIGIDTYTGPVIFVRHGEDLPEVRNCAWRLLDANSGLHELRRPDSLAGRRRRHLMENAATSKLPVAAIPRPFGAHQMTHRFSSLKESTHGMAL